MPSGRPRDLWLRQVERNRPPVRFTVERWNVAATVEAKSLQAHSIRISMNKQSGSPKEQLAADSLDENLAAKKMKTLVEEVIIHSCHAKIINGH